MATDINRRFWSGLYQASDRIVRVRIGASIALAIAAGIVGALAPLVLKELFDRFANGTPIGQALPLVAGYLGMILVTRLLGHSQGYLFATGEQRFQQRLAGTAFKHVLSLPMDFHLQHPLGAVVRANNMMLQGVRLAMVHIIHTLLPVSAQLVTVIVVVANLFSGATWLGLAFIALAYASVFAFAARWQSRATALALAADTHASTLLIDGLVNIEPIKVAVAERPITEAYDRALANGSEHWRQASVRRTLTGVGIALLYLAGASALIVLATSGPESNAVSVGALVLLFTYLAQIFNPLEAAGYAFQDLAQVVRYFGDWQRIARLPAEDMKESDVSIAPSAAATPPEIEFHQVVFAYGNGREVLSGLSFKARPGQVTAIVGSSGAGKTSIARALVRYRELTSGAITINGVSTRDIGLPDLRSKISVVSQDSVLFHATLRQNLLFPPSPGEADRLDPVLDLLRLSSLVARLPHGLDTVVGERGQQLSGGERQRVAIARALLRGAPILVLDEPTSALDLETEEAVRAALFESPHPRTSLLITHRLELAAKADKIIVIANGCVVEEGSHSQLVSERGVYSNLWREHHAASRAGAEQDGSGLDVHCLTATGEGV